MKQPIISVKYSEENNPIHSHFHDGYQLIYVVKGTALVTVSGRHYPVQAGALVMISRLESHAIQIESDDYSRYMVQISPDVFRHSSLFGEMLFSVLVNRPKEFRHAVDMSGCSQLEPLLQSMAQETAATELMQEKMLLLMLCQLLVLCCRTYPEQLPENPRNLKLVHQIQRYIEKNVAERFTLTELAERFNMSQSYLSHLFKDITGYSVIGYLNAYRLIMAKHYLVETDWEIGRIVETCGFSDNSNFSRTFKTATGCSPSSFRSKYQE